jgi:Protein of unknown function (DUF2911)
MKKLSLCIVIALVTVSAFGQQIRTPRPSPQAKFTQTVGVTDITVNYSRPGVKGRTIWGGLVPYDKVWRTGANEATTITFSEDVTISGQKLPKGTYSLHTTPGQSSWKIHFNSVADQWGSYSYDAAKDVVVVNATPVTAPHTEWLTIDVPELTTDKATFHIRWGNVAVPFTVDTGATQKVMTQLRNALNPSWQQPFMAANFAFENKGAATDQEISDWLDKSLAINQNISNLWLKARFLQRLGKTAEARKTAEEAAAKANANQQDFANEIRRQSGEWK